MVEWNQIAQKIQFGAGKEANVLGPPWKVYRIGASATGDVLIPGNVLFENVKVLHEVNTPTLKRHLEAEKIPGVILYELRLDTYQYGLKVGDLFVLNDQVFGPGYDTTTYATTDINAFVMIQNKPNKVTIGARLNQLCHLVRQKVEPSSDDEWEPDSFNTLPVCLVNGTFVVGVESDTSSLIPIGLFPVARPYGDKAIMDTPAMPKKAGWCAFLPPLKGFKPRQGDRILMPDGTRYYVIFAAPQESGACGTYLFLEREKEAD